MKNTLLQKNIINNVIFPFAVGIIIYLLFRNNNLYIYDWIEIKPQYKINLTNLDFIKENLIYSFPDFIWVFTYLNLILIIWNFEISKISLLFLSLSLFIFLYEILQYYGIMPGTYDFNDFLAYLLGIFATYFINRKKLIINLKT